MAHLKIIVAYVVWYVFIRAPSKINKVTWQQKLISYSYIHLFELNFKSTAFVDWSAAFLTGFDLIWNSHSAVQPIKSQCKQRFDQ